MRAFARFENEIWCMDLAFVDELANDENAIKYLLVGQDKFDRTVDAKRMKTKDSKKPLNFFQIIAKESAERNLDRPRYSVCRGVQKVFWCWGNTCSLHKEWNKGNLYRKNNQVTQKYLLQIYIGTWIQIQSQNLSVCQIFDFEKSSHDEYGTKQSQKFRFYVTSLWSTYNRIHFTQICRRR